MIWNIIKLLVAVYIIKTCVIDNELVQSFENTIKSQFDSIFRRNKKEDK